MDQEKQSSGGGRFAAYVGILLAGGYLLNPGFGVFELIPDNLPFVGNLDEATAAALLFYCVQHLRGGREVPPPPPPAHRP